MKIKLNEGKYYMIGVAWDKPFRYKSPNPGYGNNFDGGFSVATFNKEYGFPSESIYFISELDTNKHYAAAYKTKYPLWVDIISNDSGRVSQNDSIKILFQTYKGYLFQIN